MDRDQHTVQDAAEHYAVYVMQRTAEEVGVAGTATVEELEHSFLAYLDEVGVTLGEFETGLYGKYKRNVDSQVPRFVTRLSEEFPGEPLDFWIDEATQRSLGKKADFFISVGLGKREIPVSLKNYIGGGGITRPQVSSGTFLSFANRFVFDRLGVGSYVDPREPGAIFQGSNEEVRNAILAFEGRHELIEPLQILQKLNQGMREELLRYKFFDQAAFRREIERIAPVGIRTVLRIFDILGIGVVREKFLASIGMDGTEEALFFDDSRYVDSITDRAYHDLRELLNDSRASFEIREHKQNLRLSFAREDRKLLSVDVPFTINSNGAWWRPKERFEGIRVKNDKGHRVELQWGQLRPYKSRELATSTNTYLDLRKVGIFGR
jgi:hypothetical protein